VRTRDDAPSDGRPEPTAAETVSRGPGGLERLEHRNERLGITLRFTYAFHAREVRFERSAGEGFERIFPETFSFHAHRHDPAELYLQLEDVWGHPQRIARGATRRDSQRALRRLAWALPRYLERNLDRLEAEGDLGSGMLERVWADVAVLVAVMRRFMEDKGLDREPGLRLAAFHLRKLALRTLEALVRRRVSPAYLEAYVAGTVTPFAPDEEVTDTGMYYVLAEGDPDAVDRWLVGMGERAFYAWVEDVCLEEANQAFEVQESPFADRETEVLRAVSAGGDGRIVRGRDLAPWLRRPGNRDCRRVLAALERWFLRQYDVHHAAAMIEHDARLARGEADGDRVLSRHSSRNYAVALGVLVAPFAGASLAYTRWPRFFDLLVSVEVGLILGAVLWFLLWRFCWRRDLSFFHASVPRIGAGIIVGFLPVFLIDEVWDLVSGPTYTLVAVIVLLGFATLLYLYVEVSRRLGDTPVAFARARGIFLLGLLEAYALGLLLTSLFGRFMAQRNWGDFVAGAGAEAPLGAIREAVPPVVGELPRILGIEPFYAFPSAALLMTFLSFFIGTFLQLMWEDIPLTEPL